MKQPCLDKDDIQIGGGYLLILLGWLAGLALVLWLAGFHIVHKRPDWQIFGCKQTYINYKGEDTGEC